MQSSSYIFDNNDNKSSVNSLTSELSEDSLDSNIPIDEILLNDEFENNNSSEDNPLDYYDKEVLNYINSWD
ncbi:31377_t:CDS:1 [Racocetra persica]|uniref:31377_t:CDS:1 n=1 Tax=Racocetra persica TaxID=160502 RepID=A0ACA9MWM3_9GLOM|nr:31377_t:CDS:1 [Racocetra persica]